jgi:hypothetical protein
MFIFFPTSLRPGANVRRLPGVFCKICQKNDKFTFFNMPHSEYARHGHLVQFREKSLEANLPLLCLINMQTMKDGANRYPFNAISTVNHPS